jgi:CBS domain-containing protein
MNAADIMTQSVVSIQPDASILEAARLMLHHKVSGLPVVHPSGTLVGIVTEGDFLRRVEIGAQRRRPHWIEFFTSPGRLAEEYVHASGRKVHEVMSTPVCSVVEATSLPEITQLMEDHAIKRVPVLRGQKLLGIITRADFVRAILSLESQPRPSSDEEIHKRLLAELKKQPWAVPLSMIRFIVKDGAVEFSGVVRDEKQRQALRVVAENIPGIKTIADHGLRVEPVIGMLAKNNEH